MKIALETLGIKPAYHGYNMFSSTLDNAMWAEGLRAKFFPGQSAIKPFGRREFDQLLGRHAALTDMPANGFAAELIAAYPDAKVVLVERDFDSWFRSFDAGIISSLFTYVGAALSSVDKTFLAPLEDVTHLYMRGMFRAETRDEVRRNARAVYTEHYALVRRVTPKERLLEFRLRDGWAPLCAFLGKEVPDCPFPWVNDAEAIQEIIRIVIILSLKRVLWKMAFVPCCLAFVALGYYCR